MPKLRLVGRGDSPQAQAQARGKLFEKLMAEVLRRHGYQVDHASPSVNYSGMEIDIEGRRTVTGTPLYAECKCYENEIDAPKFQAFYGKYTAKWRKEPRSDGLFIAVPGLNSHAKAFYRDNCELDSQMTVRLLEEEQVLLAIFQTGDTLRPDAFRERVPAELGTPGDWILINSDLGLFFAQYIVPIGSALPTSFVVLDARGREISDRRSIEPILKLIPELTDFALTSLGPADQPTRVPDLGDTESVVEVRGSSSWFEYQFPAAHEFFVGREPILHIVDQFIANVIHRETSFRGLLFEANSGWGKSSLVLAAAHRLSSSGHFVVPIDCRSASSSQFVLRLVKHVLDKFGTFDGRLTGSNDNALTGFDGAIAALTDVGRALEQFDRCLVVFLDQFENVFFLPEVLRSIRDLFLRVGDNATNVVVGFSWKTDLVGLTSQFPYQTRDAIYSGSKQVSLTLLSHQESDQIIDRLQAEIRTALRRDLAFLLSESSQGFPWLLKKLCAHVKSQIESGVAQMDIANGLLNVEELFSADVRGLSSKEEETLRRIARSAPIGERDLGEDFSPEVVQSLVHRRLIMRIGSKLDVYWDVFRDYLNSGHVPVQENYFLRLQVGSVMKATRLLAQAGGRLSRTEFQEQAALSDGSFYNVVKDIRLLRLGRVEDGVVSLTIALPADEKEFGDRVRAHVRERLRRNRLVRRLLDALDIRDTLSLDEVADLIHEASPYINAAEDTWHSYGRSFADWMDTADLAVFERGKGLLSRFRVGSEVKERRALAARRRTALSVPGIQYGAIERVFARLTGAMTTGGPIEWTGLTKSTISKGLAAIEDLEFARRRGQWIELLPRGAAYLRQPADRQQVFAEAALTVQTFSVFVKILEELRERGATHAELGQVLRKRLGTEWNNNTAEYNAKIMLDWARHAALAPGRFAIVKRVARRSSMPENGRQLSLFEPLGEGWGLRSRLIADADAQNGEVDDPDAVANHEEHEDWEALWSGPEQSDAMRLRLDD